MNYKCVPHISKIDIKSLKSSQSWIYLNILINMIAEESEFANNFKSKIETNINLSRKLFQNSNPYIPPVDEIRYVKSISHKTQLIMLKSIIKESC